MTWRDQLRPGSFRDVPFHVDSADQDGGRRQVVHEFAQRDDVFIEDLGLGPREFRIEAYVLGKDYFPARDALIAAIEDKGPGTLVHPYRGALTVACVRYSVRESAQDGGIAYFSLTFVASAIAVRPAQSEDTTASAEAASAATSAEAQAGFVEGFDVESLPGFVATSAAATIEALGDRLSSSLGRLGGARDALSNAALRIDTLRASASSIVRRVPDLAGAVFGLISSARLLAATPRAALQELAALIGYQPQGLFRTTTPARAAEARNAVALGRLVTLAASSEAVRSTATMTFDSYDDAVAVRDDLADRLESAASAIADQGDDAGFETLNALRLALVRDVTQRGGSLSRVYGYTPTATQPALVIAHRLYADAGRADEIVARNSVAHPGFVPGGSALEVLTDG